MKPSTTTTAIQNQTDRKSFLRSIHRCRATGDARRLPVDPPDRRRTPRTTLGGTPPRGDVVATTVHRGACAPAGRALPVSWGEASQGRAGPPSAGVDLGLEGGDVGQVAV